MLPKIFIKDYKNYKDSKVRLAYGKMCGVVGIISNFFLCTIKIIVGMIIGSIAILADGINNLADAGSSIVTLVGFKLAGQPSDKDHPFGHERYEYITGLIVSVIIFIIGVLLLKSSVEELIAFEVKTMETRIAIVSIGVLVLSIIVKCIQSLFNRKYGRLIDSTALIATSTDSLNDCISTGAVLISLVVTVFYPNAFLDGIMGIVVSIFIIISGLKLIKETVSPLIGEAPTKELTTMVMQRIMSYDGVLGVHDLVIHSYGPEKVFITIHVEVDSHESINVSHDMIDNIEKDFIDNLHLNLVIHMDPVDIHDEETLAYKEKVRLALEDIDPVLMFHDFRVVKGVTHTNLIFDVVIPSEYKMLNDELKKEIDNRLSEENKEIYTVITFDYDYTGGE